jgi:hypothetical protein
MRQMDGGGGCNGIPPPPTVLLLLDILKFVKEIVLVYSKS